MNNHIQRLKNEDGEWVDWNSGFKDLIKDYYQHLFTEGQADRSEVVLNCISRSVSDQQNRELLKSLG